MEKSGRVKNSILNLITGIGGQLLVILLKFITRTVFISTLGKSYLGINGLFSDILTMLSLTELGLDTAINFKLYKPLGENDYKRVRVLMKFYKNAYRVIGVVILILGLCLIPFLPLLIKDYSSLAHIGVNAPLVFIIYLMQSVSSYLFWAYKSAIVKADQKEYLLNIANYAVTIATNICQILILIIWQNFIIYTAVLVLFNIIQNIVNAIIAQRSYPEVFQKEKESLSIAEIKDIFKDLGALFIYKVNTVVLKATDNMVLSAFIGIAIVGMYSNYLMLYTTITGLLNRVYGAVKASMGNLFAVADKAQCYKVFERMNFITIVLYGTACVGIAVEANELINCWIGDSYIIPQPFSVLIGIEILLVGLKTNLGQIRNVSGAFRQMWFRPVLSIIINLIVSISLVQVWGIYGVLIGTIIADLSTNLAFDPYIIHKYSFENYKPVSVYYVKNLKYVALLFLVGFADMLICSNVFVGHGWLSLIVHCLICGISVPLVFYIVFKKTDECEYFLSIIKRILNKITSKIKG